MPLFQKKFRENVWPAARPGIGDFAKKGERWIGGETDGLQLPIRYKNGRLVKQLASTNVCSNSVTTREINAQLPNVQAADQTERQHSYLKHATSK